MPVEVEAGISDIQGYPLLHSKPKARQGYMGPFLKTKTHHVRTVMFALLNCPTHYSHEVKQASYFIRSNCYMVRIIAIIESKIVIWIIVNVSVYFSIPEMTASFFFHSLFLCRPCFCFLIFELWKEN